MTDRDDDLDDMAWSDEPLADTPEIADLVASARADIGVGFDERASERIADAAALTAARAWADRPVETIAAPTRSRWAGPAKVAAVIVGAIVGLSGATAAGLVPDPVARPIDRIGETIGIDLWADADLEPDELTITDATVAPDDGPAPLGTVPENTIDGVPIGTEPPTTSPPVVVPATPVTSPPTTTPATTPPTITTPATTAPPTTVPQTTTAPTAAPNPVVLSTSYDSAVDAEPIVIGHDERFALEAGRIGFTLRSDELLNRRYGIVSKAATGTSGDFSIFIAKPDGITVRWRTGDGDVVQLSSAPIELGRTYDVVVGFGPDGASMWIDGELEARSFVPASWTDNPEPLAIGGLTWESAPGVGDATSALQGAITDLTITAGQPDAGYALPDFDSTTDDPYVADVSSRHELNAGSISFTMVNDTRANRRGGILTKDADGLADGSVAVSTERDGSVVAAFRRDDTDVSLRSGPLERGRAYEVVIDFGPTGGTLRIDGEIVARTDLAIDTLGNGAPLVIGAVVGDEASGETPFIREFGGTITDLRFGP